MITVALSGGPGAQSAPPPDAPHRVVLKVTAAPATAVALTWRMAQPYDDVSVQYALATVGTAFAAAPSTTQAALERSADEKGRDIFHYSAVLAGLTPATRYVYRVGRDTSWSEWAQFTTASATAAPVTFVWFGDPQDELLTHCARVFREAHRMAPDAGFWLFSGDLTSEPEDRQLGELFAAGTPMFRMTPVAMTPGNHDMAFKYENGEIARSSSGKKQRTKTVSPLWNAHYTLPRNGPAGFEETSYTFDYQGVRVVMVNSNDRLAEQAAWLEARLADNPNRWTVVAFHHPFYSSGRDRDDKDTRAAFQAIIEKHGVDLVLAGHDHTYARSHALRQDTIVPAGSRGTVYVNSSSGPKFYVYTPTYKHLMVKAAENVQLFQVITADAGRLTYRSYTAAGVLFDEFDLQK